MLGSPGHLLSMPRMAVLGAWRRGCVGIPSVSGLTKPIDHAEGGAGNAAVDDRNLS